MNKRQKEICVGVVGANKNAGWAKMSHVPAIKSLLGLKLAAVATRNEQSAREAAQAFGADRWFDDPFAMIRDDRIDLLTIAVNVPAHRDLVQATLSAGKAVYCEAPLGRSVAEAEEMASAVGSLHTAIGLQGRHMRFLIQACSNRYEVFAPFSQIAELFVSYDHQAAADYAEIYRCEQRP